MRAMQWVNDVSGWVASAFRWASRSSGIGCADCPIVMSCGREPSETCLPRLEALAGGRRRQIGPQDTCNTELSR